MKGQWQCLSDSILHKTHFFEVHSRRMRAPHYEGDFYWFKLRDWVNVIPITADNHVVLVEQFRHGTQRRSLEFPAGVIEPDEAPKAAALRELREETGLTSSTVELLGICHPNSALQDNRNFMYLARDVVAVGEQQLDQGEDITVHYVPCAELPGLVTSRVIDHSLALSAYLMWLLQERGGQWGEVIADSF